MHPYPGYGGFPSDAAEPAADGIHRAGAPLEPGEAIATEDRIVEAIRTVYDPEIPVNIYDLGLIYGVDIRDDGGVKVSMTLTAPACPVAGTLPQHVADTVALLEGVGEVEVELVWDPPWSQERMSEDARLALGMI